MLISNKLFNCIVESSTYDPTIISPGRKLFSLFLILKLEKNDSLFRTLLLSEIELIKLAAVRKRNFFCLINFLITKENFLVENNFLHLQLHVYYSLSS